MSSMLCESNAIMFNNEVFCTGMSISKSNLLLSVVSDNSNKKKKEERNEMDYAKVRQKQKINRFNKTIIVCE